LFSNASHEKWVRLRANLHVREGLKENTYRGVSLPVWRSGLGVGCLGPAFIVSARCRRQGAWWRGPVVDHVESIPCALEDCHRRDAPALLFLFIHEAGKGVAVHFNDVGGGRRRE